jgi:hypothetical protein
MGLLNGIVEAIFPNPSKEAVKPLNQIPSEVKPLYQPYVDAGKTALPGYQDMMKKLMENPQEFLDMIGKTYKQSPGYDWNVKQGQSAVGNANAAGGMAGTPQHEQMNAEMTEGLASKDYNEYMDRAMKALGIGASGTGDIVKQGASSSGDLAKIIADYLGSKSNLLYTGGANQNTETGGLIQSIVSLLTGGGGGGGTAAKTATTIAAG